MIDREDQTFPPPRLQGDLHLRPVLTAAGPKELIDVDGARAGLPEELTEVLLSVVRAWEDNQSVRVSSQRTALSSR